MIDAETAGRARAMASTADQHPDRRLWVGAVSGDFRPQLARGERLS